MEKVQVPAQPGRLVKAVASMGYDPEVALCDLMDNSIDAGATTLNVLLEESVHDEDGQTDTVGRYLIADDGCGMDSKALINAFTLGSEREYASGSLGKFGLGLKSAGLSLGDRLTLVSKRSGGELLCAILSVKDISNSGKYQIDLGHASTQYQELWEKYAPDSANGTLLIIDEPTETQPAYTSFLRYFRRYCSNVYHLFLEDKKRPLSAKVNDVVLEPVDPLFFAEAHANGPLQNPQDWDGKRVHLLLDNQELSLGEKTTCLIAATHLVHPPSFEEDGSRVEVRDRYQIEIDPHTQRPRHGFYVYRNRRIIVMAERFHGLISSQVASWAFRGRLMFDESADDVLALDVKKRHMQLPKGPRNNLKNQIATYQHKSVEAWKEAGRRAAELKKGKKDQIANESIASTPVGDLQYAPGADLSSAQAVTARAELQAKVGAETLAAIQDTTISKGVLTQKGQDKDVVVPVQGLKANAMWLSYPAVEIGRAETLINKSHSWVAEAYAAAEEEPRIALVLYQLFTILARAELEVRSTTWSDVSEAMVGKVIERFRRKASAIGEDLADSLAVELKKIDGGSISEE